MVQTFVKRPTSPLHFEPLDIPPEDILYPGSDDEADEGEREKKRVRIEDLGRQYLDGRPLFIQSAGLRGPFDQGWVNPWARKKRGFEEVDLRSNAAPKAAGTGVHNQAETETIIPRAKRRSITDGGIRSSTDSLASAVILEDPRIKRRKLEDAGRPMRENAQEYPKATFPEAKAPSPEARAPFAGEEGSYGAPWLKTDPKFLQLRPTDDFPSSTPTPIVRPQSKPRETTIPHEEPPVTAFESPQAQDVEARQPTDVQALKSRSLYERSTSRDKEESRPQNSRLLPKPAPKGDTHNAPHQSPQTRVRTISLSKADSHTKNGYAAVRRLSQEAVTRRQDRHIDSSRLSQDAVSGASQNKGKPAASRLAPYVSELDLKNDAATSAGLKVVKKAPTPRPSPHAVPPSTNLPEFQYRYASRESQSSASKSMRSFIPAPAGAGPPLRRRSHSTSSSDSSEFVKEFEAAQAKAGSKSFGSSYSSSPIKERQETTSVKKNTQAMRRLTFTASGEPRIADSCQSSRPSARSAAAVPSGPSPKRGGSKSQVPREKAPIRKESKKSSDVPLTNGNVSHDSAVLPEAQVVSDVPVKPAQLPSGSSTNLLETDKQSPKFISLDDEDSYLDLSTQAAMQKAQRSFKDDIISPVKSKVSPSSNRSPEFSRASRANIHLSAHGRPIRAADSKFVRPEPEDEEPMSTQAMADAISPFAVTTIKKRPPASQKGAGFAPSPTIAKSPSAAKIVSPCPSPTHSFHKPLSMSTTPSTSQKPPSPPKPTPPIPSSRPTTISKPLSTLTSFSILRNGTMTESSSILQDGQQSQHDFEISLPVDPFGSPFATAKGNGDQANGSWDLNAAIEDAGSFLGDWDVEAEARKEGKQGRKMEGGVKGILSVGKGNS